MPTYQKLIDLDIEVVGEALRNSTPPFWENAPIIECGDYTTGVEDSTYKLVKVDTAMLKGGEMPDWRFGQDPPEGVEIEKGTVVVTPSSKHGRPFPYPKDVPREHLIADLNNQAPIHLDQANRSIDKALAAFLVSTAAWGAAVDFTGTNPLKAQGSDTKPLDDIDEAIRDNNLDDYEDLGLPLECWVSRDVLRIMAANVQYTGAGSGSGTPSKIPMPQFVEMFRDIHGFSRVVVLGGTYGTADEGATQAVGKIASGVLWIGNVDRRQQMWDLKGRSSAGLNGGPDGALALAVSKRPDIRLYEDDPKGVQFTAGIATYHVISPRKQTDSLALGRFFGNILS